MLPRELVLTALQHQKTDHIPTALGGGPYGLVDDLYLRLIEHLQLGEPVTPFRSGHNISYMDDRLLERLGVDFRYCWPGLLPNSPVHPGEDEDTFYDSYGQVWKRAKPYYYTGEGILKDALDLREIEQRIRWPDLTDPRWTRGVAERARFLRENTKKRVNIISTRQSIKPFRKIRKEVLRYQTIVTRLCYGESGYSTLFFASRKDYTNTHTFLCQSLFFLTVINL